MKARRVARRIELAIVGEASRVQAPWANGLSEDLAIKDIETTRRVVAELRKKLEPNGERAS